MNTLTQTTIPCCPGQRRRALPRLSTILTWLRREGHIARDTQRLAGLSDRDLQDIGISRDEIPLAVRHGRYGDIKRLQRR